MASPVSRIANAQATLRRLCRRQKFVVDGGRYYLKREASKEYRNYWGTVVDPDGTTRHRVNERNEYLDDLRDDIALVNELLPNSILDIGCGMGWFLDAVRANYKCGTEISQSCHVLKNRDVDMYETTEDVPGRFDVVRCHHVIEHMSDPERELVLMKSKLDHGGLLLISTPDFGGPCAQRFGGNYRMLADATHCSLFTNESMHRMLRDYGLEILDVKYPFPERYESRLSEWCDRDKVSPPYPGNWMTFYATH